MRSGKAHWQDDLQYATNIPDRPIIFWRVGMGVVTFNATGAHDVSGRIAQHRQALHGHESKESCIDIVIEKLPGRLIKVGCRLLGSPWEGIGTVESGLRPGFILVQSLPQQHAKRRWQRYGAVVTDIVVTHVKACAAGGHHHLGGIVTFGDGPDGGREATFDGRMDYPSQSDPWDGYCVVQAKFLQRPKNTQSDQTWALKEIEKELKAYAKPSSKRRLPEYYIFATNVVLTPVATRGGKDQVADLFEKYKSQVPIKGWAVWDYDQLGTHLDANVDIRTTYGCWITSGDVLAKMLELIEKIAPRKIDFLQAITIFLSKELMTDQTANLEQAGHTSEERIPLARVFVDLPTTPERAEEPPSEDDQDNSVIELVSEITRVAKDRLDPLSTFKPTDGTTRGLDRKSALPGRIVLVGGPGQGKTTVGQYACQLFRVALLRDRPPHLSSAELHDAIKTIENQCEQGRISIPAARRFPVRIVLSEFAAAINGDPDLSLLAYIAKAIEKKSDRTVLVDDIRHWLGSYPWFVVLDGLDEVPPSTNREDVLKRIEEFWIEAANVNADVLVLATTRPQGYSDDFSPTYY